MEKIYRVKLNSKGMPNFSTAEEIEQGWIPCSERMPTKEEQDDELGVLVTLGNGYSGLEFDYYYNGLWDDWNGYVIAWMPLPKPWKGADDE